MSNNLSLLIEEAKAKVAAMSPEEREAMWAVQRESWVRGEMGMRETSQVAAPSPAVITAGDGTSRKSYYGEGHQPWDSMLENGWAPQFAAGSILKYLRRSKQPEHSLESARWYFKELCKLCQPKTAIDLEPEDPTAQWSGRACLAMDELVRLLNDVEWYSIGGVPAGPDGRRSLPS